MIFPFLFLGSEFKMYRFLYAVLVYRYSVYIAYSNHCNHYILVYYEKEQNTLGYLLLCQRQGLWMSLLEYGGIGCLTKACNLSVNMIDPEIYSIDYIWHHIYICRCSVASFMLSACSSYVNWIIKCMHKMPSFISYLVVMNIGIKSMSLKYLLLH